MMLTRNHILSSTLVLYLHLMQLCFALLIRPWFCAMYATFDLGGEDGARLLVLPCSALLCPTLSWGLGCAAWALHPQCNQRPLP